MDDKKAKLPHTLYVEERKKLILSGITDIGNFDDENISVYCSYGEILIKGENLKVIELDVETGQFCAEGKIVSLRYSDKAARKGGFLAGLMK